MELRHLRYFVAVATELSFTRAAQRLKIAQPPLSQQIRDLEEELGCRLFERAGRRVLLTTAGTALLPEARDVLERAEQFREHAAQQFRGDQGRISIALISAYATPKFATMLRAFQKKNPGVKVDLSNQPSAAQVEALARGEIDIGILRPRRKMPPNVATHVLRRERMRLAVPTLHPLAKRQSVEWKELAGEPLFLVEPGVASPDYYAGFFERARAAGFEPLIRQHTQNVATKLWLVSAGLGIAPMPNTPDIEQHPGVVFLELPKDAPITETAIAWRKSDPSAVVQRFVAFAREQLGG